MLEQIVAILREHVLTCSLCYAKGFICEICMKEKDIIFPFELESTSVCQGSSCFFCEIYDHWLFFSMSIMFSLSMS